MRHPFALAFACCALLAACGNPLGAKATFDTVADTLHVWALNQPPGTFPYPDALNTPTGSLVRAEQSPLFDLAFDIDPQGRVVLLPTRRVLGSLAAGHTVGLQKTAVAYDSVSKAPASGFTYDSITYAAPGDVFVVQASAPSYCSFTALSSLIYSKLVIDSLHLADRSLFLRLRVDPNCGFRSLAPGRPAS